MAQIKNSRSLDDVDKRARQGLERAISKGVCYMRSHLDLGSERDLAVIERLMDLRRDYTDKIQLEYSLLCSLDSEDQIQLAEQAFALGADAIGGAPALNEHPQQSIDQALEFAHRHQCPLDLHIDETADPDSGCLEYLAERVLDTGFSQPVTASHCCSLGFQADADRARVIEKVRRAGVHIISLPACNLQLIGRGQSPVPRGSAPIKELLDAGVNVSAGCDNVQDPFHPWGDYEPLGTACISAGIAQLDSKSSPQTAMDLVTKNAASAMNLSHRRDLTDLNPQKQARCAEGMKIGDEGPMGRIMIRGEHGHDIIPELYPLPGEAVIDKSGKGAFFATDLELLLRSSHINSLIICGVTTEVCVHTTVREANDRGYQVLVPGLLRYVLQMPDELIFGRILPATGLMLCLSTGYYAWLAWHLAKKEQRTDVCALPSGIGVAHMFVVVFVIMLPIQSSTGDAIAAWEAGLSWVFIQSIILMLGGYIAPVIRKITPRAALLGTLAGVSVAFISMRPALEMLMTPVIGLLCFAIILLSWFGKIRYPFGIPAGLVAIAVGTIIAWSSNLFGLNYGGMTLDQVVSSFTDFGFSVPIPAVGHVFSGFEFLGILLVTAIPFGIYDLVEAMDNVESAEAAGDKYPTTRVVTADGVVSMIGCLMGNPFINAVYIGHPGWKSMGGRIGYSAVTGISILLLACFGVLSILLALIPVVAILPILLYIGMLIGAQAFQESPSRHAPAIVLALVPHLAAWAKGLIDGALGVAGTSAHELDAAALNSAGVLYQGLETLGGGAILSGLVLGAIAVFMIDQKFKQASFFALAGAFLSFFGFMHGEAVGFAVSPEAYLERIDALNPALNCYTSVLSKRALAKASALDRRIAEGQHPGPLAGVPFAVKNLYDIEGVTTLAGSKINAENPIATKDALLVERMENAGAILLGGLAMGEYAYDFTGENQHYGACRNPWDLDRMSGGSSSGSGSATAAGLAPISLGSDTNGSIRVPASLCGLFGLKPTFGRLPRTGTFPFCDSLDHLGPLARNVEDLCLAFSALQDSSLDISDARQDPSYADMPVSSVNPNTDATAELRVARAGGYFDCRDFPDAEAAVNQVCDTLQAAQTLELEGAKEGRAAAYLITNAESSTLHLERLRARPQDFDDDTRDRFLAVFMERSVLIGVLLITALHAFDEMVLVIALPAISADLGSDNWYGLIIAGYILASIVGMTWAGREMDRSGPAKVILTAAAFFITGLGLAVVSWDTFSFMVARILQGVGGGMGWTISFGIISLLSDHDQKPKAVAAMDVAWIFPSLLAPLVGGVLVDYLSWRWIFVVQLIPLAISILLVYPRIKHLKGQTGQQHGQPDSGVLINAGRLAIGCGLILYILGTPLGWLWLGLIPSFWFMAKPLHRSMPQGWLRLDNPLSAAIIVACLAFLIFYSMEAYQPLYLIEVRDLSTLQAGLILTCASVFWMTGSQLTANNRIPGDYSQRILIGLGILSLGIASLALLLFTEISLLWAYPLWAISGLGMGITFNTARATAMINTQPGQEGKVAAGISLSVSLGLSLATGFGGAIKNQTFTMGYTLETAIISIWVMSMIMAIGSALLLFWHHKKMVSEKSIPTP
eukprot:g4421.t1